MIALDLCKIHYIKIHLSNLLNNLSGTDNKELKDTMMTSLSQSINNKIPQIDKIESENKISQTD